VRKDFVPAVSTKVSEKVLDVASPVFDDVTSGVADADSYWVPDLELQARGYYFDGLDTGDVGNVITPNAQESADAFLARLATLGYEPVAYGKASFTGVGQQARVQAMTKPDDGAAYRTKQNSGFWHMGMGVSAVRAEQTGAGIPYRRLDKSVYGGYGKQYKSQEARSHVDGH